MLPDVQIPVVQYFLNSLKDIISPASKYFIIKFEGVSMFVNFKSNLLFILFWVFPFRLF